MAEGVVGRNMTFPIFNSDGTPFNDLVLHKATYDTVVMSLGDKITGDVYYKDNTLAVTMGEYIEFKQNPNDASEQATKFILVNPPTVVKEGMVSDNSELRGMTKYSFTFYHPMCLLANFPFSDVAVTNDQKRYLSENKSFSWIGTMEDYVAKLNKNLEGTQWIVIINTSSVAQEDRTKLSDVMTFDNQSIADALKTGYETWKVPYVVDVVTSGEVSYSSGKRFKVMFGLPTTEIRRNSVPFVFKYGQGVGLKNNSRTPRNNKIVTRIAGYGSEDNIPYGYPQIIWTGNQSWDYTINNDSTASNSYPIYDGIVGGQKVRLIKHPFTRTHLMPSVYVESLNKKVNPNAIGYDPTEELVDYYDADNTYENPINPSSPSYEIHEFGDIKPELGDRQLVSVATYDTKSDQALSMSDFIELIDKYYSESENDDEKTALVNLKESIQVNESDSDSQNIPGQTAYNYWWDFYTDGAFIFVTYSSSRLNFTSTVLTGEVVTPSWDDTMDDDGNYVQSYFKVTLPALGFDLYACAAITQEMKINMRSGACMGCSFDVAVDWDAYKANFYDEQGNFDPAIGTGHRRDADLFPDSTSQQITLIVKKDIDTFGTLMPNIYQQPAANDKFVIIGISLPTSYITSAQTRLDDDMKQYMRDNNVYYYDYPLKFDEYFLAQNTNILTQMKPNIVVYFEYAGVQLSLYIKQMTVKYGDSPLPQYNITLTDDVEIVLNQIGQVASEVSNLRVLMGQNGFSGNASLEETDKRYLRKDADDTAAGLIRMIRGMQVGERFVTGLLGEGGIFRKDADGKTYLECDRMYVRMKAYFDTVEVRRFIHSGGNRIASAAGMKCSRVEYITSNGEVTDDASLASKFRCYFRAGDNGTEITNDFVVNDLAYCKETNIAGEQTASSNTNATRDAQPSRSATRSAEDITISLTITNNTSAPVTLDGDVVFVLSNPDVDGNYHGWQGTYNRTSHLRFSNSAVTLAANESRTVSVSGELYRRSPANDSEIADAGRRSNVLLYVGGNSEIAICSNMSHSIVFQDGGSYSVSISQIRQGAVQRFYWRKVIGVSSAVNENGEHYIDLSKTDCATGSDVPIAQDDIIQLGNTTDNSRQGAIIEYVSGEDAPSYQIYQDINSYNLVGKNYVRLGYDSESGGAQAYIGNPDGSTYLWYHMVTEDNVTFPRLDIKANVEFSSPDPTYGTETLDDFIAAITQNVENIQDQVDGNIESWFYDYMPVAEDASGAPLNRVPLVTRTVSGQTVPVYPYYDWYTADGGGTASEVTTERTKHLGDTFYDNSTGYAFRFTQNGMTDAFEWAMIEDSAVIKALADAARAQDTADHKRRSFVLPVTIDGVVYNYPFPPYDVGDLWLNAKYPYDYSGVTDAEHNKYNNDVLRCVTSQGESGSFSIAHWVLASKYTDDTVVNDFIDNTYAPFVQNIQEQVDKKAETWYQDDNPESTWYRPSAEPPIDKRAEHVGDIWCDTSANGGKKTYIYKDFGTSANPRYAWAEQAVPDAVFDTIDGKCAIYISWNGWIDANNVNNLQVKDLLIPQADISQTIGGITYNYVANKVYRCTDASIPVFREIEYTDDTTVNNIISRYGQILNIQNPTATNVGEALAYLREVLGGNTTIDGGLILSHMIALKNGSQIMAGMNGTLIGNSLSTPAAWYGGAMVDYESLTDAQKAQGWNVQHWAMSLFRFNGTGYLAGGNISWNADGSGSVAGGNLSWDASGNVTLQGYSINATTLQKGGVAVATTGDLAGYVTLDTLQTITGSKVFTNKIYLYKPNSDDTGAVYLMYEQGTSSVKLVGNFYATGAVSALGSNSSGGGGGSSITLYNPLLSINNINANPTSANSLLVWNGSSWGYKTTSEIGTNMSAVWSALAAATNEDINITHIISALVGCLTQGTDISITRGTGANVNKITIASTYSYSLPTADTTTKGGVKVGTTLAISNEILNLAAITLGTPASGDTTYTKVVVDGYGRIIKATTLAAGDIPDISGTYALNINAITGVAVGTAESHTNDLAITKNGTTTYITVPFASTAASATNATTAAKLTTSTYSIFGNNYITSGVPQTINNAAMSGVTNIDGLIYFDTTNNRVGIYKSSGISYTLDINGTLNVIGTSTTQILQPSADNTYNIGTTTAYYKYLFIKRIYLSSGIYLEVDGDSVKLNGNFYATGAVSALGSNSSGGGSSPISLNNLLNSMNQATVAAPSVGGVAAVYNGSNWVYSNTSGVGLSVGGNLTVSGSANIGSITTASITSAGGFVKSGSTNDYVLLAGGGTAALSSIGGNGTYVTSLGNKQASDLSSTYPSGLSNSGIYNGGWPFTYGCAITSNANGGVFQIAGQWNADVTGVNDCDYPTEMYIRGRRDSHDVWTTWTRVLTDRNWTNVVDGRYLPLTGGTLTGHLNLAGSDLHLGTPNSSSDDSGDIAFYYGNGAEKSRIYTSNTYTEGIGPYYRVYGSDGTNLYNGRLATMGDLGSYLSLTGGMMSNTNLVANLNADLCDGYHLGFTELSPFEWNSAESRSYFKWYRISLPSASGSHVGVYDVIVINDVNYSRYGHFRLTITKYVEYSFSYQLVCLGVTYNADKGHLAVTNDNSYIYIQGIAEWGSCLLVRCIFGDNYLETNSAAVTLPYALPTASCKPVIIDSGTRKVSIENGYTYSDGEVEIKGVVSGCLPLSGGRLTGSNIGVLEVNSTHQSETGIGILRNGTYKGWFGFGDSIGTYMYNSTCFKYLNITDAGGLYFGGYDVWHAGNDGSGSGLDADTVDGEQASRFFTKYWTNEIQTYNTIDNIIWGESTIDGDPRGTSAASWADWNTTLLTLGTNGVRVKQLIFNYNKDDIYYRRCADNGWTTMRTIAFLDSTVASSVNSDTLDSYHENSFLRYRGYTETNGEGSLWSQIGIKEYRNALPDGLSGVYNWGGCASIAAQDARLDIYYPHPGTTDSGIWVRTGWGTDKRAWKCLAFTDSTVSNADTVDGCHESDFLRYRGFISTAYVDLSDYNAGASNYQNPLNGVYVVDRTNYSESLACFSGIGSASGLDIRYQYSRGSTLAIRRRIDSNRVSGDWENIVTDANYTPIASYFLRKDTNDSTPYQYTFSKTNDHAIQVGTLRGLAVNGQTGEYIQLYERVHIGSPQGWGSRSAPSYGLSTYGGAWLATDTGNVGIGTTSPSEKLSVNGNASFVGYLSGVTNIDSILNFNTSLSALGIRNLESSDSESNPLIINGNTYICPTIANKTTLNILGQMTLRAIGSTTYRMQFGAYTSTYQPFLNFYDSTGKGRNVLELYTETFTGGRGEHLCIGQGFRYFETDGNGNTTLIGRTYIYGANIHFMVNDRTSSNSGATVQAMRMYANGRTFVGTTASDTSLRNINASNSHPCFLNAYSALIGKLYLYKPNTDNDTNAVWFEYDSTNGAVKLNGNFYATGAVSALGSNTSGGGTPFSLNNLLNSMNATNVASPTSTETSCTVVWNGSKWVYSSGSNNLKVGGTFTANNASIGGTITVAGNVTVSSGNITTSSGGLTVAGAATLSSTLSVTGKSSFTGNVGIGATNDNYKLYVYGGNGCFNSGLRVSGRMGINTTVPTTTYYLEVNGQAKFQAVNVGSAKLDSYSTTLISNAGHIVSTYLTVNDDTLNTSYRLYVNGNAGVSSALSVSGASNLSGKVSINGMTDSSSPANAQNAKLYIGGGSNTVSIYATGHIYTMGTEVDYSDIRMKEIYSYIDDLTVNGIAMAPVFRFKWKNSDDNRIYAGTSAQYWQSAIPQVVMVDDDGRLGLSYAQTALISAVITARKVVDHEHRIQQLEWENERLRKELENLKAA